MNDALDANPCAGPRQQAGREEQQATGLQTQGGCSAAAALSRLRCSEDGEMFVLGTQAARAAAWHRVLWGLAVQGWAENPQGVRSIKGDGAAA